MDIWWLRYLLNLILGFLWEHIIEEWKVRERDRPDLFRLLVTPVEREALVDIANVYNYQTFVETDKAGYIIRQWLASNLYDRNKVCYGRQFLSVLLLMTYVNSTRPFLSIVEKRWIAFQLLNGLRDARNRKIFHGDIKSENILVTSWNWIYLTDFASYKPSYLPLNDRDWLLR
jgi:phosphoinositide-3-kinase regulatory subunit 4